ncbi:MAG: kynureninase [Spirochaetia bacterium]|nr:kynureninase [Spirochaetia bacterium]
MKYDISRDCAKQLDQQDMLRQFSDHFYKLPNTIYMDGNSLGLLSREAEESVHRVIDEWKRLGINGWLEPEIPWYNYCEKLSAMEAPLVGASPSEVAITASTTVNLHALVRSLYAPQDSRTLILMDELNFPSDIYAVKSILKSLGYDPEARLRLVKSADGRFLSEADIISGMDESVALALFPSVLYRSGQLLDIHQLTKAAHEHGIVIGFDCSHSIGAVPHSFDKDRVDFAFWCNYKYMNSGPGGTAGLYVNQQHLPAEPAMAGWWGYNKERQFDMKLSFEPAPDAGAFHIGTPHLLSAAPLEGSLILYQAAGIDKLRTKSLQLTEYLMYLIDALVPEPESGYSIGTPREAVRRGGHIAVEHPEALRINEALKQRGVVPDFRYPNVIRLAPVPLYTNYIEVWKTVQHLKEIVEKKEYLNFSKKRGPVA